MCAPAAPACCILVILLEQVLRDAPNLAMGAPQTRFQRAVRWAPVGNALSPNSQCDRHRLVGDVSQFFYECPVSKLWQSEHSKLVQIKMGILLNTGSTVTRIVLLLFCFHKNIAIYAEGLEAPIPGDLLAIPQRGVTFWFCQFQFLLQQISSSSFV